MRLVILASVTACATAVAKPQPQPHKNDTAVVPSDPVARRAEQQKKCDAGDAGACRGLALRLLVGEGGPQDQKRAATIWFQGCLAEDYEGCQNLGWIYTYGIGVPKNETLGAGFLRLACEHKPKDGGCVTYYRMVLLGQGVARDEKLALQKLDEQCASGSAAACANAAIADELGLAGHKVDIARAEASYKKACDAGAPNGCEPLGRLLQAHKPADTPGAITAFRTACDRYNGAACAQLAALVPAEASALKQRACMLGAASACATK